MYKKLLVVIPARAKSKSIKNKNIIKINKIALIEYTFKHSKQIREKSKIIHCSTDSIKIQKIAKSYKIKTVPLRPKNISGDLSRDLDFINHTLNVYSKQNIYFKYGLILRPTNPIRKVKNLNKSYARFKNDRFSDSMKSIFPSRKTPYKTWIKKVKYIKPVVILKQINESFNAPRQILPNTYDQTGTYEYFKINYKSKIKSISGKKITYFDVSKEESLDIDNLNDIKILDKNK